ncbi:hypothetical protein DFH09DRAFT_1280169 [Mycena vulgaris]|nr:hypothetical protein DFH09DRAFT_1280169 [Mycena vulgaris]
MPFRPTPHIRLSNIATCLTTAVTTLEALSSSLDTPFFGAISSTTRSLITSVQTVKRNKDDCAQLMEQIHQLLYAIIGLCIDSHTGGELSPDTLYHIGKFAETLHKIHLFVDGQQETSRIKLFFRQGGMTTLLKDCNVGLQQTLAIFKVQNFNHLLHVEDMQRNSQKIHEEVLQLIETLSDSTSSDRGISINGVLSSTQTSSSSFALLPAEPKIFHGRETELSMIITAFSRGTPRIAIIGAGGMGKTSVARAVLHASEITSRYGQNRFFVACDIVSTSVDLAGLIGAHLGLKPGINLTRAVIHQFSSSQPSLLILDNLETVWEPIDSRRDLEGLLSLLADIPHLALIITMRGAERPTNINWTHPFLPPLQPLTRDAARRTFIDIADDVHDMKDIEKILILADNIPLAISLLAHLVDYEGTSTVLNRWEVERTSLLSAGTDRGSNLDLSISLSLTSPRITTLPHSCGLLGLLSMLPDGLSDVDLLQSGLPIDNILACKAALLRTSLAYSDDQRRLKALLPIREYMQRKIPPPAPLIHSLLKHFQHILELYIVYDGALASAGIVPRIAANFSNIQNVLLYGLNVDSPDLVNTIYCICDLDLYGKQTSHGRIPAMDSIPNVLPHPRNYRLEVYVITEVFRGWTRHPIPNAVHLGNQAVEYLHHFDDPDLKCKFYITMADYYRGHNNDIPAALDFCETALSVAISYGNIKRQCDALAELAWTKWLMGDYSGAQIQAYESHSLGKKSAHLFKEARALRIESGCWYALGDYKQSISLSDRARNLLGLCGMSGGEMDLVIMMSQAEVHKSKSEYVQAYDLLTQILRNIPEEQDRYQHAFCMVNIAEIQVILGAKKEEVQANIDRTKPVFHSMGDSIGVAYCDTILGYLAQRDGDMLAAQNLFQKCLRISWANNGELVTCCLERLADGSRWGKADRCSTWTTVFLVHVLKSHQKSGIYKALQFMGDVFLAEDDQDTATCLLTVALEGFTQMDIHYKRAECMLRLGDIRNLHGDLMKAAELWEAARPLFLKSSQSESVLRTNERLAMITQDTIDKPTSSLTRLSEINAPTGVPHPLSVQARNLAQAENFC